MDADNIVSAKTFITLQVSCSEATVHIKTKGEYEKDFFFAIFFVPFIL